MVGLTNQSGQQWEGASSRAGPLYDEGGSLWVRMNDQFNAILQELKKILVHLQLMTDTVVENEDVEPNA